MAVIGTAGHVDHGKSTLLAALTGRDTDRLAEEKRRGLTIDLGFAWMTMPSGREVSFVDVPGHERFIKNMLAGVDGLDGALFVVAADEGWMPQSEEHLAILDLLDIEAVVVAITKTDRVDADIVELVSLEVLDKLAGTALAEAPIVAVSAVTGEGLAQLVTTLDRIVPESLPTGDPRLWVDRSFTVDGAGQVVTGTLVGGSIDLDDRLELFPGSHHLRARSMQSHEVPVARALPSRRVAINVSGAIAERGSMISREGTFRESNSFTARLRAPRGVDLTERGAYHAHIGTTAVPARVRLIDSNALITLDRPVPLRYGDRLILRETGRRMVAAGGVVLDPHPPRRRRDLTMSLDMPTLLEPSEAAETLLHIRAIEEPRNLYFDTGAEVAANAGTVVVAADRLGTLAEEIRNVATAFHTANPLRPGVSAATLASQLGVDQAVIAAAVATATDLETDETVVRIAGRTVVLDESDRSDWDRTATILESAGFAPPRPTELPASREVIHQKLRSGALVRLDDDIVMLRETVSILRDSIGAMPPDFTVADFRDAHGLSRRFVIPLLEWSDREGLTIRRGDHRTARPKKT